MAHGLAGLRPGSFDLFFFSFFFICLFFFLTFDLEIQINSNKFVKICKILNVETRHLGTIFVLKKITKILFWSNMPYVAIWEFSKLGFINISK